MIWLWLSLYLGIGWLFGEMVISGSKSLGRPVKPLAYALVVLLWPVFAIILIRTMA